MFKKLEFFVMRKLPFKFLMDSITTYKAKGIGKAEVVKGTSRFIKNGNEKVHLQQLQKQGYTVLDNNIGEELVNKLVAFSESISCYDNYNDATQAIDPKQAPEQTHVAHYKRQELVQNKLIMDLANDPAILNLVQDFLGAQATISNVNLWWSFGGRKQAEHAQLFHRDLDDWKFCKLFIYLTDVSDKAGPHVYVEGSSVSPKYRKIRRYSDAEIEQEFGKDKIKTFVAPKGTAFVVDTYGFHKGLLPEKEDRLLLQIQYSLNPIAIEEYVPVASQLKEYHNYTNRLLVK